MSMLDGVNALKNLFFVIIFVALSFSIYYNFIIPAIHDLKETNREFKQSTRDMNSKKRVLKEYISQLKKIKANNKFKYKSIFKKYNKSDIQKLIKTNLSKITTVRLANSKKIDNNLKYQSYIIHSQIDTPAKFFKFIDKLKFENIAMQISFPIKFKTKRNKINLFFRLKVYSAI